MHTCNKSMSLLSESKKVVGEFQYLNADALSVRTVYGAGLYNFSGGANGDVLTWNDFDNQCSGNPKHLSL